MPAFFVNHEAVARPISALSNSARWRSCAQRDLYLERELSELRIAMSSSTTMTAGAEADESVVHGPLGLFASGCALFGAKKHKGDIRA
jgi:hypothetical protein